MGGGAWPFLVGGVICLVDFDNERDVGGRFSGACFWQAFYRGTPRLVALSDWKRHAITGL